MERLRREDEFWDPAIEQIDISSSSSFESLDIGGSVEASSNSSVPKEDAQ